MISCVKWFHNLKDTLSTFLIVLNLKWYFKDDHIEIFDIHIRSI